MQEIITTIKNELQAHTTIPYFGLGIFEGVTTTEGEPMPYDNDSFILAMNNNRPMSARLMYEYSRAAMHLEQRRGVEYMRQLLNHIYTKPFEPTWLHTMCATMKLPYIIDTNRDTKLLELFSTTPHYLITGKARIMAELERFEIYKYEDKTYTKIAIDAYDMKLPTIFKPMGAPLPEPNFIISDADYVDWLTEAMGGFGVPPIIKQYRKEKKYLFMGMQFNRDTDRMVANELTINLAGGYVINDKELTKREAKFVKAHNLNVLPITLEEFTQLMK